MIGLAFVFLASGLQVGPYWVTVVAQGSSGCTLHAKRPGRPELTSTLFGPPVCRPVYSERYDRLIVASSQELDAFTADGIGASLWASYAPSLPSYVALCGKYAYSDDGIVNAGSSAIRNGYDAWRMAVDGEQVTRAVNIETGENVWSRPLSEVTRVLGEFSDNTFLDVGNIDMPHLFTKQKSNGDLELRRAATGAVRASWRLPRTVLCSFDEMNVTVSNALCGSMVHSSFNGRLFRAETVRDDLELQRPLQFRSKIEIDLRTHRAEITIRWKPNREKVFRVYARTWKMDS